ncbi:MAG: hypothetical protein KDJ16_01775 [Hyphomicrobiales bacterium]|nr:hypothetical protein [Hyphomicrobiales bacterium]
MIAHPARRIGGRFIALAIACVPVPALAVPVHYDCTAWGGSHTSRYTFVVDAEACTVRWLQIDRMLEIEICTPPIIVATKPFAPAPGYRLRFNLATGAFSDHVPGWSEHGHCRVVDR